MSRTIKFAKAGGPEVLDFVEVQVPAPRSERGPIKVKAIGINRAEAKWRVDDYVEPVKSFPAGLGYGRFYRAANDNRSRTKSPAGS
jgi:NADPH:quinone reductase-like Zn-dependent oxidoreductase